MKVYIVLVERLDAEEMFVKEMSPWVFKDRGDALKFARRTRKEPGTIAMDPWECEVIRPS